MFYIKIKKNPDLIYSWLKWLPVLLSESGAILMVSPRRYENLNDARDYAKYLAKELNIKAILI